MAYLNQTTNNNEEATEQPAPAKDWKFRRVYY